MANNYHIKFSSQCNLTNRVLDEATSGSLSNRKNKQSISIVIATVSLHIPSAMPKVKKCSVLGCSNTSNSFRGCMFRLPPATYKVGNYSHISDEICSKRQKMWIMVLRPGLQPRDYADIRVCEDHFVSGKD